MYQYASKDKTNSEKSKTNTSTVNKSNVHTGTKMPAQTKSPFSPSFNAENDVEKIKPNYTSRQSQLVPISYSPLQKQLMPKQESKESQPLPIKLSEEQERLPPAFTKPNNTGIPLQMKEKFENLSGFSFDDVKVHYNSGKPAQLQALAYTQGNQVYVAPGQEKHLGHELGHVVQQKAGFVRETTKIGGFPINDDPSLEEQTEAIAVHALHQPNIAVLLKPLKTNRNDIVQRTVSTSSTYPLNAAALIQVNALDNQLPAAIQNATTALTNPPPGHQHTPRQAHFLLNPNPMNWGSCIEEQLNPLAINLGWQTQYQLAGSRPDYYKQIAGVDVFADLTTAAQSFGVGAHITAKLTVANINANTAEAADITYVTQPQGVLVPIALPGTVTAAQAVAFFKYKRYLQDDFDYHPNVEQLGGYLPQENPSMATFAALTNAQRNNFRVLVDATGW